MSLTGFLFAFKIWILETFPMASTYYILTTRMPRAVRWARSSTVIGSYHAHNLMDVSTDDRMPRDRLVPTPWEESQEWYTESHRWFSSTAGRRQTKRARVTQDVDEEVQTDSEGDQTDDDAGVSRPHGANSYDEPPFRAGHSPAGHYQHSPHVDPYANRWSEFTRWKDDYHDFRTSHRIEHEDLERRQAEKWASDRAYQESLERRIAEMERQFSAWQIPSQQQGGQPSQPDDIPHGFGSPYFGGSSQYTDNSSSGLGTFDDLLGSQFVTPPQQIIHGSGAAYTGLTQGQHTQHGTFGALLHDSGAQQMGLEGFVGALFQDTPHSAVSQDTQLRPSAVVIQRPQREKYPGKSLRPPFTALPPTTRPPIQRRPSKVPHPRQQADAATTSSVFSYTSSAIGKRWHDNDLPDYWLRCIPTHAVGRDWWGLLLGLQGSRWLENDHIDGWVRFIRESRSPSATWTVMTSDFMHVLLFGGGPKSVYKMLKEPDGVPWWSVEHVFIPICIDQKHWVVGDLNLETMKMVIYDSFRSPSYVDTFNEMMTKFANDLPELLTLAVCQSLAAASHDFTWVHADGVPQQQGPLGDCGPLSCMFLTHLANNEVPRSQEDESTRAAALRCHMTDVFWSMIQTNRNV
ncbi:hypothetical protein L6452_17718 [Arctium lappa]|uniref:Uncharacterized protein n=1 Tax=Arctium lappa TaxID=4217 RepID=A0ACB9C494_ARCLA|nr:hypothetical protein L6452_17718 [Arctium lappa]